MIYVNLVFEDDLSEVIMSKLLNLFESKYSIVNSYPGKGYGYLKSNIRGFSQASVISPFFMLTDLDTYACPLSLIKDWIDFQVNPNFIYRIAVREVEAWLLADIAGLSDFFKVPAANFPMEPENDYDPKRTLISLAKKSRIRRIREDIVPINLNASIGPNYNGCLIEFVFRYWNIHNAIRNSKSLRKTVAKLENFEFVSLR